MNTRKSRLITLATIVLLIILAVPAAFAAAGGISLDTDANTQIGVDGVVLPARVDNHAVPVRVSGYPVVHVESSHNDPFHVGLPKVIVYAKDCKWDGKATPPIAAPEDWPEGWTLSVFGGGTPMSIAEAATRIEKNLGEIRGLHKFQATNAPILPRHEMAISEASGTSKRGIYPTFASVANLDPDHHTVNGQKVRMVAPQMGTNQDKCSNWLLNGLTNTNYFTQTGFQFFGAAWGQWAHTPWVVYTSHTWGLEAQYYNNMPYETGHTYEFMILYYDSQPDGWLYSAYDRNNGNFEYVIDYTATGSNLVNRDYETSVFWENYNTNQNWYSGFTNPVRASYAQESRPGYGWFYWFYEAKVMVDSNGNARYATSSEIGGNLRYNGTARWYLNKILLQ